MVLKPQKPISHEAQSKAPRNRLYRALRDLYILTHPVCERCNKCAATEVHHRARREGYNLFNWFAGLCRDCHDWVHGNIEEARETGWLIDKDGSINPLDDYEWASK